jgi:putative membrane protein
MTAVTLDVIYQLIIAQDSSWCAKRCGYPAYLLLRAHSTIDRQEERSAMNDEPTHKQSMSPLDTSTRLAYERTYLAHERTLMGWVRTAISLISFGFTIAKVFEYLREKEGPRATLLGPRVVGIIMIALGLVALGLATMQHRRASKVLRERCPDLPPSLAGVMAAFFALLGILALFSAILRQ